MLDVATSNYIYQLRTDSYANKLFIYTNKNDIIPIIKVNVRGDEITGKDFINSLNISIKIDSIVRYDCISDEDSFIIEHNREHKILKDICDVDNLNFNLEFIYKDIPLHERIISLYLSKIYSDISLSELKKFWKLKITESCDKFIEYVNSELSTCSNDSYQFELNQIKDNLITIKSHQELNSFKSKDKVCTYWPSIILPAPSFVKPK
jgi:hypothetical protein